MTVSEAKTLIIKNATPYFESKGWQLKKLRRNEARFFYEDDHSLNFIGISTTNYNPEQLIGFGIGKRIKAVEDIMQEVNKAIPFQRTLEKEEPTLYLLDKGDSLKREDKSYCTTEEDIIYNLGKIFKYLNDFALPLLEQFNDVREIDKRINGEDHNFWASTHKKPFNLAHRFYLRRLIIAKLSGRKDYEEFINNHLQSIEKAAEEANEHFDRNDLSDELVYCIHLLNNVEPLY